jgi:tripartite-type tricarboxylate transporter receptor subunit TctC
MTVKADSRWKNVKQFVQYAKQKPEGLTIGMIPGGSAQIFAAAFTKTAEIDVIFVPFKGDVGGATALAGGHIDAHFAVPVAHKSLVEAGKIRFLALAAEKREGIYKEFPSFKEQGLNVVIGNFHGLYAPKGTQKKILETLAKAVKNAMQKEGLTKRMEESYIAPRYLNPQESRTFLDRRDRQFRKIIEELGLMVTKPKR